MSYVMNIETVKIKDFLFSTNKLKCIQGASYLLDYVNNIGIRRILDKYNIKNNRISLEELDKIFKDSDDIEKDIYEKIKDDQIFYIAAGNAKFIVKHEEDYEKIKEEIELLYKYLAPNAKIIIEKEKINENDNYSKLISKLASKTNIAKSVGIKIDNIDLPMIKKCELSNSEKAEILINEFMNKSEDDIKKEIVKIIYPKYAEEKQYFVFEEIIKELISKTKIRTLIAQCENLAGKNGYISRETFLKIMFSNFSKDLEDGLSFYSQVVRKFKNINVNYKIEDYPELSDKSNIGFLYSDGDGLGEHIKNKTSGKNNEEYLRFIKPFSIILDYITRSSLIDALEIIFKHDAEKIGAFFIVGGDDVCALFKANDSILIAEKYLEIFSEKMKKVGKGYENITTSCGLLIAKDKVPIYLMMKQALKLQKNAKKKRYDVKIENLSNKKEMIVKGYIDFQNIGSQGNVNIDTYRSEIVKYNVIKRPYSNDEYIELVKKIMKLKEIKFPTSKLRYFYDVLTQKDLHKSEKNMHVLNALFNTKTIDKNKKIIFKLLELENLDDIKILNQIIFEREDILTNILDLVELYQFIKLGEDDENE